METSSAYDLLISMSGQKSSDGIPRLMDYLYGYSQLLSIKEVVLKNIIDEKSVEEYKNSNRIIEKYEIDISLLKQGTSVLCSNPSINVEISALIDKLKSDLNSSGALPVDLLLEAILKEYSQVKDLFHKGKTLADLISFQKENESDEPIVKEEKPDTQAGENKSEEEDDSEKAHLSSEASFSELAEKCIFLYTTLKEIVIGQDDAVRTFVQGYFQAELQNEKESEKKAPKGLFLFAGPPGVGKTFLATSAAEMLGLPVKRFNMSEYSDHQSPTELIGLSKKYAGATKGLLTSFVKDNPNSIVIFDEVEKAHLNVIHLFLQILDAGTLQDAFLEEDVEFKNTFVIFTTNVGKSLYEDNREQNLSLLSQSVVLDALEKERHPLTGQNLFPAAICSRFATGNVVMFNHLKCQHLIAIVDKKFNECSRTLQKKYNYELKFDKKLASLFLYHISSHMDARIVTSQSISFIQNELYEFARQALGQADFNNLKIINFEVDISKSEQKIKKLFVKDKRDAILFVSDAKYADAAKPLNVDTYTVDNKRDMIDVLTQKSIDFVVVDPLLGCNKDNKQEVFSIEDYDIEGVHCFNTLKDEYSDIPVYILEADSPMRDVDKNTFLQQGAHGVISYLDKNELKYCKTIDEVLDYSYLEQQVSELSGQEKVVNFNTSQSVSADGENATIRFYDFNVQTAVKGAERGHILQKSNRPQIKFADVIGAESAKKELQYFCECLKNPKEYALNGFRVPKGILLYGPPGTGKTMLARAMAGEAEVTYLPTVGTDFLNKYVGEGEERIRQLFRTAQRYAPSIIFIDEIDAIGKERTGGNSQYTEVLLNTLLTEMDGFVSNPKKPVFVIAATNFPLDRGASVGNVIIDPALQRRFDNKICVDLPNEKERLQYLQLQLEKKRQTEISEQTLNNIAARTTGESLANISNVIELALRNAYKLKSKVSDEIMLNALEEFYYGEQHEWGRDYYKAVAYHEAGHAYVSYCAKQIPQFVTIVSRGNFGGYMQGESSERTPNYTKEELLWRIRIALAGRASEIYFFGKEQGTNTGVSSDLQNATNIVLNMLTRYGMSENSLLCISREELLKSKIGEKIISEAQTILNEEMEKTIEIIASGKKQITDLAEQLLVENQLIKEDIVSIFQSENQ